MPTLRFKTCKLSLLLTTLFLAALASIGCVQRTLSLTSEPPGALVFLNDEEVGRTPVRVPFTYYGSYGVRLEHDNYKPLSTERKAKAPWWEAPGPDLLAEMVPHNRVELAWHFNMELAPPADPDRVIDRASQLRALLRRESPQLDTQVAPPSEPATTAPAGQ